MHITCNLTGWHPIDLINTLPMQGLVDLDLDLDLECVYARSHTFFFLSRVHAVSELMHGNEDGDGRKKKNKEKGKENCRMGPLNLKGRTKPII
jgi:hypothetical protein